LHGGLREGPYGDEGELRGAPAARSLVLELLGGGGATRLEHVKDGGAFWSV
jgi:hypothetical protein